MIILFNNLTLEFIQDTEICLIKAIDHLFQPTTARQLTKFTIQRLIHALVQHMRNVYNARTCETTMGCLWAASWRRLYATWKFPPYKNEYNPIAEYSGMYDPRRCSQLVKNAINLLMLHIDKATLKLPHTIENRLACALHHITISKVSWSEQLIYDIRHEWVAMWTKIWLIILQLTNEENIIVPLQTEPNPIPPIMDELWLQWIAVETTRATHNKNHKDSIRKLRHISIEALATLCTKTRANCNEWQ